MGKHRKSKNLQPKERFEATWVRNLKKNELGAVIFGCKNHTFKECLDNKIFGLPAAHISYVKNVTPGLKLFLFNYSDRKLHGIFKATTHGAMNISPLAWITGEGATTTPYAAQVRFDVQRKCRPLIEAEFKPIIAGNYYEERLFWFELDKEQAGRLTKLFLSSPFPEKIPRLETTANWNRFDALAGTKSDGANDELKSEDYSGMTDMRPNENHEHSYASVLDGGNSYAPEKKWTELFETCASSSAVNNGKCVVWQEVNMYVSESESANLEFELAESQVASNPLTEASTGTVNAEYYPNVPVSWEEIPAEEDYEKETYTNEVTCIQDHEGDIDDSDTTYVSSPKDRALLLVKEAGEASIDTESNDTHFDALVHEGDSQTDESLVVKLMQEIEGLKESNMKHKEKIDSLLHELDYHRKLLECEDLEICPRCEAIIPRPIDNSDKHEHMIKTLERRVLLFLVILLLLWLFLFFMLVR